MRERKVLISEESAEKQIDVFLDYFDVYLEEIGNEAKRISLEASIDETKKNIMYGYLEIKENDEGDIIFVQNLKRKKEGKTEYEYNTGRITTAKVQMNVTKADDDYGRMYSMLGSLCGTGTQSIMNLKGVDIKVAESLSILFLGCSSG